MSVFRRILAPTDYSHTAAAALQYAKQLALQNDAVLRVLHVVEDPRLPVSGKAPELQKETESAQQWLDAQLSPDERARVKADVRVIRGYPAFAIPRHAVQEEFDLIVMGTHGRGDQPHMPWGSVAEKVVGSSPCPVLTIRHPKHQALIRERLTQTADAS